MPFTFAHPAASLLFLPAISKRQLSATGLIIGAMAPDFEYFLHMKMTGELGHTFLGIFILDLPLALMLALLFHGLIRNALVRHLPLCLRHRFDLYTQINWYRTVFQPHFVMLCVSILLGIATHIIWDMFTHETGFAVQHLPLLQEKIHLYGLAIPVFKLLQHLSSGLGLLALALWVSALPKHKMAEPANEATSSTRYWLCIACLFIVIMALWASMNVALIHKIGHIIVATIACGFWAITLASGWHTWRSPKKT